MELEMHVIGKGDNYMNTSIRVQRTAVFKLRKIIEVAENIGCKLTMTSLFRYILEHLNYEDLEKEVLCRCQELKEIE